MTKTLRRRDDAGPIPLYHRVYLILREGILAGSYAKGAVMPTEETLCAQFGVSRTTMQTAMARLVSEGLVVRHQGRGTFVAETLPIVNARSSVNSLLRNVNAIGKATEARLLDSGSIAADEAAAALFDVPLDTPLFRNRQLRLINGEVIGRITAVVPPAVADKLEKDPVPGRPMLLRIEDAGIQLARADQSIRALIADPVVAGDLEIEPGMAVIQLHRLVYDMEDQLVEEMTALYRGDRYEYRSELVRDPADPSDGWIAAQ